MLGLSVRESLRIEVWDQSGIPPVRRAAAEDAENGRGLELVESLSKEWGCDVLTTGARSSGLRWKSGTCDVVHRP